MYTYLNEQISLAHKQPIETIALHTGKRENGKNIYMYIRRRQRRRESLRIRICRLKTQQGKKKKLAELDWDPASIRAVILVHRKEIRIGNKSV